VPARILIDIPTEKKKLKQRVSQRSSSSTYSGTSLSVLGPEAPAVIQVVLGDIKMTEDKERAASCQAALKIKDQLNLALYDRLQRRVQSLVSVRHF